MKRVNKILFFFSLFFAGIFCFKIGNVLAANVGDVVINELMWMGSSLSTADEFIELKNTTNQDIDLTGWKLEAVDGTPNIELGKVISANGYFLLERTDDTTVDSVVADLIYTGALNDSGEYLKLKNSNGEVIDEINASGGWTAGDKVKKATMEKTISGWQTSVLAGGTPKAQNSGSNSAPEIPNQEGEGENFYSPSDIVINEFVSDPISGESEWIELYSNFGEIINLNGWTIEEGAGSITHLSGEILPQRFFAVDKITGNLNNDGDIVFLFDNFGNVIDQVSYGNWDDGNKGDNALNAKHPDSVSRLKDGADTNIDNADFAISTSTKGAVNNVGSQNNLNQTGGGGHIYIGAVKGSVVINEIVSDTEDGPEWVEIYNKTNSEIDLSGWHIEEGSEAQTFLKGKISGHGYLAIENVKGNLNNTGDIIFLFDSFGNIIDQVAYGNWDDGNIIDNAPQSSDPNGIGRIGASQDTNNDLADFQVVSVLTANVENILVNEQEKELKASILKNKIIINEIFPNPKGDDGGEFIELKNISGEEIDLSGFLVGDNSKRRYKIKDGSKVKSGEFFVVSRSESNIALNNTGGDAVVLYDEQGNIIDEVEYLEKASDDKSYILTPQSSLERLRRSNDCAVETHCNASLRNTSAEFNLFEGVWEWTDKPSMAAENILIKENQPPVAVIDFDKSDVLVGEEFVLDASDSYDTEGENLILEWQVGTHRGAFLHHDRILTFTFDEVGSYEIKLTLSDGEKKTVETRLVDVLARAGSATSSGNLISKREIGFPELSLINEFLPNPKGSDEAEFIELFNSNDFEINLKNFYLDDGDWGSSPYHIKDDIILKPFGYFVFERALTKLALNNTSDAVRLLDENKNVLERVDYSGVVEGASFSREFDGNWFWTRNVTKGTENQIEFVGEDSLAVGGQNELGLLDAIDLSEVREMDLGDKIKMRGIVIVLPGVLGSQVFYISKFSSEVEDQNPPPVSSAGGENLEQDLFQPTPPTPLVRGASADSPLTRGARGVSSGIQIYSYKKDFPKLKIGDEVEVVGVLSQSGGEHRLKISQKDDIKILGHKDDVEPVKITADEIGKELEGGFVLIEGEIVEISGSSIFIDDGSGEAKVYLKESSGVKKSDLKEGDVVSVAGIVSQTNSGFRLLPRFQDDIKKVEALGVEFAEGAAGENSSDVIIESRNSDWLKYITAGLGAVVLILGIVVFRMRKG